MSNLLSNNKVIGARDLPLAQEEDDLLDTSKYIDALVEFTRRCCTPMSIALQGDWGTGKTSFINKMQYKLNQIKDHQSKEKSDEIIHTIYFNTWQYSQFNAPDELYTSFVVCLIESLCDQSNTTDTPGIKEKTKKILGFLANVTLDLTKQAVKLGTGYDLSKAQKGIEELIDHVTEKNRKITDLKKNFSELISSVSGDKGRVIIFIDDLDRLNPEVAVALLETIKLFMDVEKCVFVLAIDYDVVVRGIRKKYGSDMDNLKCRSFFDKIIQLPFRMPTEKYMINQMIEKTTVGEKIRGYTDVIANLIKDTLGPNPRTLKRVINSFELLSLVEGSKRKDYQNALLLVSLIMQIYDEREYSELLESIDDIEIFNTYRDTKEKQDESKQGDNIRSIIPFFRTIDKIGEKCGNDVSEEFINSLTLSAMTTVSSETGSSKPSKKHNVDRIEIFGEETSVDTPTAAIRETVSTILMKYKDRVDDIIRKHDKYFTEDPEMTNSMFAAKNEIIIDGRKIYIAIKTSYEQKLKLVVMLCKELDIPEDQIKWYDGKNELLWQ